MALIVEILHQRTFEVRQRVRLERFPTTLGRQLDNDVVLDDPYVDAHHARFVLEEDGSLVLEDLGSLNKLATTAHPMAERIRCAAGAELQVGRTRLRIRDDAAPVAAAISLTGVAPSDASRPWYERPPGRIAAIALAATAFGITGWLATAERNGATIALTAVLGFFFLGVMWAGIWAVAGRVAVGQFRFGAHLAIASWIALLSVILGAIGGWIEFLSPDNGVVEPVEGLLLTVALGAMIALHLAESSLMPRAKRILTGAIVVGVIFVIAGAFALADDDAFSDVPKFSSVIKSVPAGMVPQQTAAQFDSAVIDLRGEVDELLSKEKK